MRLSYALVPALLVAAAIVLVTWQGLRTPAPEAAAVAEEPPRYAVTGAEWVRLSREGEPEFRARADAIDYYTDGSAKLRGVRLDALGGAQSPWHVEAPAGEAPPRERRLKLEGGVQAEGALHGGAPVAFTAPDLWVDLLRRELYTDARVEVQSDQRLTARGLRADFAGERIQLLNDVQVDYAPES